MSNFFTARLVGPDIGVESRCAAVRRQRELSEEPVTEEYADGLDENAIAVKLTSEYNVPMDKALRDVKATIEKLVSAGVAE